MHSPDHAPWAAEGIRSGVASDAPQHIGQQRWRARQERKHAVSLDRPVAPDPYALLPVVGSFAVTSPHVAQGEQIDLTFAYGPDSPGGQNQSPALSWSGAPEGTSSYAVSCFDPDAPTPSGFWHWNVVDIPADVTELPRGAGPTGVLPPGAFQVTNDFGNVGYDGPAPPPGDQVHRYFFVVHAVDVPTLRVGAGANATVVAFNLVFHTLARAILVPVFSR